MDNSLKYWLALNKIKDIGPVLIKSLIERFGSAEAAWGSDVDLLKDVSGFGSITAKAFADGRKTVAVDEEMLILSKHKDVKVFTLADKEYPGNLKNIYDPPPVLYLKGNIPQKKAIAIVGTRSASHYGLEVAERLAFELSSLGFTIVSGMAEGIDTAAHKGALRAEGSTVAVFGCGLDIIFPPSNQELAVEIVEKGALVSEFALGTPPDKWTFPKRNRIISGLSLGVIVVEGNYDSGAMITAKQALDQGREVFAVPGMIDNHKSKGPHWLIKQGAKLIESVEDIFEELRMSMPEVRSGQIKVKKDFSCLSEKELVLVQTLSDEPVHIDVLPIKTKLPIHEISGLLAQLEIKGFVRQLPGKNFILKI